MTPSDLTKQAKLWIALHHADLQKPDEHYGFEAIETFYNLKHEDVDAYWQLICEIYKLDSSDEILSNLGAGPLEDYIALFGRENLSKIRLEAQDPRFRRALGVVWKGKIADDVWHEIVKIADKSW